MTASPEHGDSSTDQDRGTSADESLVDWATTGRRVGRSTAVLLALAVVGWVGWAVVVGRWLLADLGNWLGLSLAAIFVMELVVVGGSALRGMLRAGERGERLSAHDVGLLPPLRRGGASSESDTDATTGTPPGPDG